MEYWRTTQVYFWAETRLCGRAKLWLFSVLGKQTAQRQPAEFKRLLRENYLLFHFLVRVSEQKKSRGGMLKRVRERGNEQVAVFDDGCWFSNTEGDNRGLFSYCGSGIDCTAILHWAALKKCFVFLYLSKPRCVCSGAIRTVCMCVCCCCAGGRNTKMCVCVCVGGWWQNVCMCACTFTCIRTNMHVRTERLMKGKCVCTWKESREGCKAELN